MNPTPARTIYRAVAGFVACLTLSACNGCPPPTPTLTTISANKAVTTLQKTFTMANCAGSTPRALPVEPQDWWNALPAANRQYPFAGWEAFQAGVGGCAMTRIDAYRAVATFNMTSLSHLKGLVASAELVVATRAIPSGVGTTLTAGPFGVAGSINVFCSANVGGLGGLVRFGPAAAVPVTTTAGDFEMLGASPFPAGSGTVYTLPTSFVPGAVAGATSPTTATVTGNGGSQYATDVSGAVTSAVNSGTNITWMAISNFEGNLPGTLSVAAGTDCRTSVNFDLRITHR